jgi:ribose 1,5-bisphosphokinase PhnN
VQVTGIVFAVVGPSGCGKTALIEEMLKRFADELVLLPSLTTRAPRNAEDDRSTRFVSREEFERMRHAGELVQSVEYAGNLYGDVLQDVNDILESGRHAIRPLVETSVRSFRDKGYRVAMARVVPEGSAYRNRDPERVALDAKRSDETFPADIEIRNSFEPGGFEAAAGELSSFIRSTIDSMQI